MTKQKTVFAVVIAAVLLTSAVLLINPISEMVHENEKYAFYLDMNELSGQPNVLAYFP